MNYVGWTCNAWHYSGAEHDAAEARKGEIAALKAQLNTLENQNAQLQAEKQTLQKELQGGDEGEEGVQALRGTTPKPQESYLKISQALSVPWRAAFQTATAFTLEAWVKLDGRGEERPIVALPREAADLSDCAYGLFHAAGGRLYTMVDGEKSMGPSTPLPVAEWVHVAVAWSGAYRTLHYYINGEAVERMPLLKQKIGSFAEKPLQIGPINGAICEARAWSCTRNPLEIKTGRNRSLTGAEAGLTCYLPLDEEQGETVAELSGAQQLAATGGDWRLDQPLPAWQMAYALRFSGDPQSHVSRLEVKKFPQRALTVEFWLRTTDKERYGTPFCYGEDEYDYNTLRISDCNNLTVAICNETKSSGIAVNDGRWHHIALTWRSDGGAYALLVDGQTRHEGFSANSREIPANGALYLAQQLTTGFLAAGFDATKSFEGELAEVRVWNEARTVEQIRGEMLAALQGSEAGLALHWPLNEGRGKTAMERAEFQDARIQQCEWRPSQLTLHTPLEAAVLRIAGLREILEGEGGGGGSIKAEVTYQAQISTLEEKVTELEGLRNQLEEEKSALTTQQEQDIAALKEDFQRQLNEFETGDGEGKTTMSELINNLNAQIKLARDQLKEDESTHRLDNVSVELKMIPGPTGVGMSFPRGEQLKEIGAEQMSVVNLDFSSTEPAETPPPVETVVPRVTGYTEALAQRKLAETGYQMEVNYEAVSDQPGEKQQVGRVVSQYPTTGTKLKPNSIVTVFVGKQIEQIAPVEPAQQVEE